MKGATIQIGDVTKSFGDFRALKGVSLDIRRGEFFSLLGPSGCGKTTLLRILGGFEEPDGGTVWIDGKDILPLPPNMRGANTVFQNYALFPHLSVYENVAFPLRLKGIRHKTVDEMVMYYLRLVELEGHAVKLPSMLSGGQKQRVAIARALINEPSVLLLDEPLSALDAKLRHHMLMELDAIHDKVGITFIYVTHDQAEALSVSDRIAVMDRGQVLQVGSPREIYESPSTSFVAQFIGETNLLEGTVESEEGSWFVSDSEGIGKVAVADPRGFRVGDRVVFTIRPERLHISPLNASLPGEANVLEGSVHESVYSGFVSKYYVSVGSKRMLRVFRQHGDAESVETIACNDRVRVSWSPRDAFIVGEAGR